MKSTTSSPPIYIGIDVSKLTLDADLQGKHFQFQNCPIGFQKLFTEIAKIADFAMMQITVEATGCYTRELVTACLKKQLPISLLNARLVRNYALAGLAPMNRDCGGGRGHRTIQAGHGPNLGRPSPWQLSQQLTAIPCLATISSNSENEENQ